MKLAFFFILLSAFVVAISCEPAVDDKVADQPAAPWYSTYSYYYMMCRLKCRQSCLEQGYWKGVCKQGSCFCYGPMEPYSKSSGFPLPLN